MKISIVIPVYNEAASLGACLGAIARQTVSPFEVIVVDNNSTDETAALAAEFEFARLIHEPKQGVVNARAAGFDAVRGDIIARIDADTVLPPEWLESIGRIFTDQSVDAVSGAPDYHDFALPKVANAIDHYLRRGLAKRLGKENFLYGANMAVRRSAWRAVRNHLCHGAGFHEDFDLAIHLQQHGFRVGYDADLLAGVSARRINSGFMAYIRYTLVSPRTYARHGLRSRRHMYPVLLACWFCYLPGHFLNKAYNPQSRSLSFAQLFAPQAPRVDPTVNVV